jgi:hypothetical protein
MSKANLFEQLQGAFTAVSLNDLETTLRQTLRHQAAQGGLVIDDEQVRRGTSRGLQGANILTQRKPNDQSGLADTANEAVRRAQWLADAN